MTSSLATPVLQKDRIVLLDSLRGFAILGILLMNIPGFAYPAFDPIPYYETGINYYCWYFVELGPAGTQRALFSMLFGAGIILFLQNQQKKYQDMRPADYFFRRQLWLLVFGLFDVFVLLWAWDILFDYACIGMIMFAFRNLPVRKLLFAAALCFLFMLLRENRNFFLEKEKIHKGEIVAAIDTTKTKLTEFQKADLNAMLEFKEASQPAKKLEKAEERKRNMQAPYSRFYSYRTNEYLSSLVDYLFLQIWDVLTFMFLGMAFFKSGLLLGKSKISTYWLLFFIGLVGIALTYFLLEKHLQLKLNYFEYVKQNNFSFYEVTRVCRALGFLGLIMLLYRSGFFGWLFNLLRPVGQMAFTNYLMQSLICGIIFYSVGFGLYGKLERFEIYIVVGCVWLFEIIFSHIWLRYFLFGPMEWVWRSLTYGKQSLRK